MKRSPLVLRILATLGLGILPLQAAFVISFDPDPLRLNSFDPTGVIDIVATNTGPAADDLTFYTINLAPVSGSSDISIDLPASVSHFGGLLFGGAGLPAGSSAIIGSFGFTLSAATTATVESPISTDFGGNFFYQASSDPAVVAAPVSYTITAVPEPGGSILIAAWAALGLLQRKR